MILRVTLLVCALLLVGARSEPRPRSRPVPIYSNQFAVYVPAGQEAADEIAQEHGFDNHGQVRCINHYPQGCSCVRK
ncbi:furin-like protease 2 isoform X3 [Odontomachus brunneus]|uniref:furin-like protease 2 isoform X3 n=1 Tax=Odontomachus brunneus TaxID=486640 RepID=UPI0013F28099|nr:furin-like protease 2 isoform X3 [Odontomachus brunneus]